MVVAQAREGSPGRGRLEARVDIRWTSGVPRRRVPLGLLLLLVSCGDSSVSPDARPTPPSLTVSVTPTEVTFAALQDTARLTAVVRNQAGEVVTGPPVTWLSADATVAAVDSNGLVTAVGHGSTRVAAAVASSVASASIVVAAPSRDRRALERLYHAAGGDAWTNSRNWLTDAPLSEWFGGQVAPNGRVDGLDLRRNGLTGSLPPELGDLDNLTILLLDGNSLTGPIPPELGRLLLLERLEIQRNGLSGPLPPELGGLLSMRQMHLFENDLSGPLPSEIGNLAEMERLVLVYNPGLSGLLPRSLLNLTKLTEFLVYATDLCAPLDAEFSEWLAGIANAELAGDCTPDRVERLVLSEFFDLTGGESWNDASGWNTDAEVGGWYGVTSRGRRVRSVSLANNGLRGALPPAIAGLTALESLDLGDNDLAGRVPADIGSMAALTTLRLTGNRGLEGFLPFSMTGLTRLAVLHYGNTDLCIPPTRGFRAWLEGVDDVVGAMCDNVQAVELALPMIYLTQAIQRPAGDVPLVAGRDALLRVFLTGDAPNAFYEPAVAATLSLAGEEVYRTTIAAPEAVMTTLADESDLHRSYNALIPGEHIQPGLELVVEADPAGAVPLASGSQTRYPASGVAEVDVVEVPPMRLTVVPVVESSRPDYSIHGWTNGIADDSRQVGLLRYAFPFAEFRARSRETYVTSSDLTTSEGQWSLVLELEGVRALEGGTGYWYGAASSLNGFVRGIARLGGRVSMGKAWDSELAHEVGHNLNLDHAPCGSPPDVDPRFPHRDGRIGAWGYDFRDGAVVSPETRRDIMGYCYELGWLSDYFFEQVISHRDSIGRDARRLAVSRKQAEVIVLSGGVVDGDLRIKPAFRATSTARLPAGPGSYRIEGFAGDAREFSLSFAPGEDQFGNKYFLFMVPSGALDRITLTGPEGTVTIGADDERTTLVVRDSSSGRVRGILNEGTDSLPAAVGRYDDLDVATYGALGNERR